MNTIDVFALLLGLAALAVMGVLLARDLYRERHMTQAEVWEAEDRAVDEAKAAWRARRGL